MDKRRVEVDESPLAGTVDNREKVAVHAGRFSCIVLHTIRYACVQDKPGVTMRSGGPGPCDRIRRSPDHTTALIVRNNLEYQYSSRHIYITENIRERMSLRLRYRSIDA